MKSIKLAKESSGISIGYINLMLTAINNATNASIKRSLGQKSSKAITVYFSVHANLKVVWNFLENPSVLVALPVPNTGITIQ